MISLRRLQQPVGAIEFPEDVLQADQFWRERGREVAKAGEIALVEDGDRTVNDREQSNGSAARV